VYIPRGLEVTLGDGAQIADGCEIWSEVVGAAFNVGKETVIARNCMIDVSGGVMLGNRVTISEGVAIYTHSHGLNPRAPAKYYPLVIGDDTWICTRALVLSSTKEIGPRAIVGPLVVVRQPVPPDGKVVR
jgi:hypothetical protein